MWKSRCCPLGDDAVYLRGGRQELLFGSQRLISPSDWSNELRTFQGVRALYHTDKIEEDAFWVQPVIVNTGKLDSVDDRQVFAGNYFKYRFNKDISLDAYYLYLDNDNQSFAGRKGVLGGYDVNTFGSRFVGQAGDHGQYLWDFEGAIQFGDWSNQTTEADMYVAGLGYWFKNLPAIPTFWVYYDHASGTQDPTNGTEHRTFNQLFPSGHSYFNAEDLFGRQNINDFHLELGLFPTNWMRFTAGYHVLSLDQAKDALYNSSGSVVRQDATGKSGTDVGDALSGTVQFHLDNHQMINVSYAHLFSGTFIKDTAVTAAAAKDQDSVWVTYSAQVVTDEQRRGSGGTGGMDRGLFHRPRRVPQLRQRLRPKACVPERVVHPISTVGQPIMIVPPWAVRSPMRAAGIPPISTVKLPSAITSGGPTHTAMSSPAPPASRRSAPSCRPAAGSGRRRAAPGP